MEEWKEYKLGNVCEVLNGRAYKQEELLNKGKYPVLRVGNIFQGNNWYYSDLELPENKYCNKGDLLYAWSCGFAPYIWEGNKTIYHYHIWKLIENKNVLNRKFLYYYLIINTKRFIGGIHGSVMVHLTKKDMENQILKLPSLPTQQKIANILSSLDDKIEVNRRINEQLEELAGALFKSWFVDFEPFKDGEFVESELVKLGSVINTTSGGTPSRKHMEYYSGNHGWVKSKELNGTFIIDTEETITDDAIAKSSAKLLPEKSILIAMYGATVGQYAVLSKPMTCNQAVCALLPNDDYPYTFLFMFAKNKKDELINKAVGSAQQNISQILIKDLDISNDTKKIKEYHKIVGPAFEIILKNQQEIHHLTTLRDTLLPKLMSGEIDVNEVKI